MPDGPNSAIFLKTPTLINFVNIKLSVLISVMKFYTYSSVFLSLPLRAYSSCQIRSNGCLIQKDNNNQKLGFKTEIDSTRQLAQSSPTVSPSSPSIQPISKIPSCSPTSASPSVAPIDYSCVHSTAWLMNANNNYDYSTYFSSQTEILTSSLSNSVWSITYNQIPYYYHNFTASVIAMLNSRPQASEDFVSKVTTALPNHKYMFGSNIGYDGNPCVVGYWPPGPVCPAATSKTTSFKLKPAPETSSGTVFSTVNLRHIPGN
jgi:hypothetical protein